MPVAKKKTRNVKEVVVPQSLIIAYWTAQVIARNAKLDKDHQTAIVKLEKQLTDERTQYNAEKLLILHHIDNKNVLYDGDKNSFKFGWRNRLTKDQAHDLMIKLRECGFLARYSISPIETL